MDPGGIAALGLDWKALLFQVLNFAILLGILRLVAYKPLLASLESRRRRIAEGLKNAQEMELLKKEMQTRQMALLAEAKTAASQLLERSRRQAEAAAAGIIAQAQKTAEQLAAQQAALLEQEMQQARQELKKETVSLVVAATEKILQAKLDEKADRKLIHASLRSI